MPRDHWLESWEKAAILNFAQAHRLEGYRRLAFMMLDANVVAVSPSSVYRVLKAAGRLGRWNGKASRKGTGFEHPLKPHEHWHVDVSYINVCVLLCGTGLRRTQSSRVSPMELQGSTMHSQKRGGS